MEIHPFYRIHHPTDFSQGSQTAFEHALRLALNMRGSLRIVHVDHEEDPAWDEFPGVRHTLERWGILESGSAKSDVAALGLRVQKFFMASSSAEKALVKDIVRKESDLVVMATHARQGISRLLHLSIFKQVLRATKRPILVVPHGVPGFIEPETGVGELKRILVPVSPEVKPQRAVKLVYQFLETIQAEGVEGRFLYVGEPGDAPALQYRDNDRVKWRYVTKTGDVVHTISEEIATYHPQLVVMLERGRNSVMDYLIPGKLERLAGESECPILVQNVAKE